MKINKLTASIIFISIVSCANLPSAKDSNIIADFSFDQIEKSNNCLSDFNGQINGAVPASDRENIPNRAMFFDGVDDYIEIPEFGNLLNSNTISISLWVKSLSSKGQFQLMLCPDNNRCAISINFYHANMNTVFWDFGWQGEGGNAPGRLYYRPEPVDTNWHHYVFISSTSKQTMKIFKDKTLLASKKEPRELINFMNKTLKIGSGDNGYFFKGYIDDIKIYSKELSIRDIKALYKE